jgi:hypothetical protein
MSPIASKIILKFLFHLPFGCAGGMLIIVVLAGISPFYWQIGLLIGFVLTTFNILLNLNDYYAIESIQAEDFLESRHQATLPKNDQLIEQFKNLMEKQFIQLDMQHPNQDEIVVKVDSSIIKLKKNKEDYTLSIEHSFINFLPDRAKNYKRFQMILRHLEEVS